MSSSHLPRPHDLPLPHLASVGFFRQTTCSPPARPVPPTPHRMRAQAMEQWECQQTRPRKRYSAASAIPRPTSGTSRQTTPIGVPHIAISGEQHTAPASSYRKSFQSQHGKPPSAWATQKSHLPRSDSLLPYTQRNQQDLSGTKQQLQLRHYSTQSLSSPSKIGLPRETSLTGIGLPKSQSSTSLLSPPRHVTLGRRLMKPISPPLPKSQTFSNLSSTALPQSTPSPSKSIPIITRLPRSTGPGYSQVNVVDALRESRMTEEEITFLRQVEKEKAHNKDRLEHAFEIRQHKQTTQQSCHIPALDSFLRSAQEATINLSANDIANTRRLENQRRNSSRSRPLFVHSAVANARSSTPGIKEPNAIINSVGSAREEEWEANSRFVYFGAEPAYWTGRYMSVCDRLRTENLGIASAASPASTSSCDSDARPFDFDDVRRMDAALRELRMCCRTEEALKSFNAFEAQLRHGAHTPAPLRQSVASDTASGFFDEDAESIRRARVRTEQNLESALPLALRSGSRIPTPVKTEPPMPNIFSRLALTKSKTTGNLTAISTFGITSLSTPRLAHSSSNQADQKAPVTLTQIRRKSGVQIAEQQRKEALKERQERGMERATETQRRISEKNISLSSPVSNCKSIGNSSHTDKTAQSQRSSVLVPSHLSELPYQLANRATMIGDASVGNLESGHCLPPSRQPTPYDADVKLVGSEKVVKSRRRPQRQSSGEIMKGFFDASISQVRKMSKRVGGSMTWAGSTEDVNSMISPKSDSWK